MSYSNTMALIATHRKTLHLPNGNDFGDESIEKHNHSSKEQLLYGKSNLQNSPHKNHLPVCCITNS